MYTSIPSKSAAIFLGMAVLLLSACGQDRITKASSVEAIAKARGIGLAWLIDADNKLIAIDTETGEIIPSCAEREGLQGAAAEKYPPCKARIDCNRESEKGVPECVLVDAKTRALFPAESIISRQPFYEWIYQGSTCVNQGGLQGDTEICCPPHSPRKCKRR
jgi:hypothetical protein